MPRTWLIYKRNTVPALMISPSSDGDIVAENNGMYQGSGADTCIKCSENEKTFVCLMKFPYRRIKMS